MRRSTVALAAAAVILAGCGILPPDQSGSGAQPAPTTSSPHAQASGESLEGRFDYDTMDQYLDAVTPMITQWIGDTWKKMPLPGRILYVPHAASGPEECADPSGRAVAYTSESYEYCPAEQSVYVGQDIMWEFYTRTGDAGPAVGLAHEFGHHIQDQMGVPGPQTAAESIQFEDQADCLAGAWTQYTDQQGWLEYPDDLEDIASLFPLIGSAETLDRDHGTVAERMQSFQEGFDGAAAACNAFFPDTPVAA